jgi:hypothetical protein
MEKEVACLQVLDGALDKEKPFLKVLEAERGKVLAVEDVLEGDIVVGLDVPVGEVPGPPVVLLCFALVPWRVSVGRVFGGSELGWDGGRMGESVEKVAKTVWRELDGRRLWQRLRL